MGLRCGLIGLPGCGKTTIFNALTAAGANAFTASESNVASVPVPDSRIVKLVKMYNAPKIVPAMLDVVDIPGLASGSTAEEGRGSKLLAHIKDVDALLHVVRSFEDANVPYANDTVDPVRDVQTIDLELVVADSQTVENKIIRISKKARTGDKDAQKEVAACEKVLRGLNEGIPARKQGLDEAEKKAVRECNLHSLKPQIYVANIKDVADADNRHVKALARVADAEGAELVVICGRDEAEIAMMDSVDQAMFLAELGLGESSRERLMHAARRALGLVNFITAGEKEVHIWTCRSGDKAPVAAGKIHTDMEKGFIRMEVIRYEDLVTLGSETAVARAGKQRVEGKDYIVQEGDIVGVRFNKS
ncbi:redox-regulated ATPase YchF [bacterium]|nr:redox-regulated ATPase YchF [bacterium]